MGTILKIELRKANNVYDVHAQQKLVKAHITTAEFHNSFRVPENTKSGNYSIKGKLLYQACDNNLCTLPESLPFDSKVRVGVKK